MVYDTEGRVVSQRDAYTFETVFCVRRRQPEKRTSPTPWGRRPSFWFDDGGRTTRVRDPLGHELSYGYDATGNRTVMIDKAGAATHFSYERAAATFWSASIPTARLPLFAYDAADHVVPTHGPRSVSRRTFAFDANGKPDKPGSIGPVTPRAAATRQNGQLQNRRGPTGQVQRSQLRRAGGTSPRRRTPCRRRRRTPPTGRGGG